EFSHPVSPEVAIHDVGSSFRNSREWYEGASRRPPRCCRQIAIALGGDEATRSRAHLGYASGIRSRSHGSQSREGRAVGRTVALDGFACLFSRSKSGTVQTAAVPATLVGAPARYRP